MARGLRPAGVDSGGLVAALEDLAAITQKMFQVTCEFTHDPSVVVADDVSDHVYRVAREAISNALKHGKARTVRITLAVEGGKNVLRVQDDGVGLPKALANNEGMGLRIMERRARMVGGRLVIETPAQGGTLVSCYF